jgi:hypothetical protein
VRRAFLCIFLGALLVVGASACGGSGGGGRYEESGFDITFKIPHGFSIAHDISVAKSAGANAVDQAAVQVDKTDLIIFQRYNLHVTITSANVSRYKGAVDQVIGSLAGHRVSGHPVEYGGLPGYEYVIAVSNPPQGESRIAVLFDNDVEYLVNCQSTPAQRDKVDKACTDVLNSLKTV